MPEIHPRAFPRNVRAIKAYEKAGFRETTDIPADFFPDYKDTVVMVKLADTRED